MNKRFYSSAEKLGAVEALIETFRRTSTTPTDFDRLWILKSIAADLRGRIGGTPHIAMVELERRITGAMRSKTNLGYENGAMVGISEELIGRWAIVKQALEKLNDTGASV